MGSNGMRQKSSSSRTWVCAVTWSCRKDARRGKADLWVLKAGRIPSHPWSTALWPRQRSVAHPKAPRTLHRGCTQGALGGFSLADPLQPQHRHWAAPALSVCGFPHLRAHPCPIPAPRHQGSRWFPEASPSPEHRGTRKAGHKPPWGLSAPPGDPKTHLEAPQTPPRPHTWRFSCAQS